MALARSDKHLAIARTIRFPAELRDRIALDAERCGRSFEAQAVAILRKHYGEDVDLAPPPDAIISLARASVAGMSGAERRALGRRLVTNGPKAPDGP